MWVQTESAIAHNLVVRAKGATIRNGATDAGNILADLPTTGDAGRKVDGSTTATAAAGDDREVLTGASVTLAGSGSSTRTGATLTYAWTQTAGETVALDDAASAAPSFTAPSVRTDLVFSLTVNDGTHDSVADAVTVRVRPPANPSSAPCVHPAPPGASFTGGDNLIDQTVTGSSISFRGFFAGTARYSFWFCRPDGTRETLGQNVTGGASGHIETVSGLASGTTYWVAVQRTGHNPTWFRWQAFTTTGAATIVRVAFANAPDADGTYVLGEAIRAAVTWSQAVTVDAKGSNDNVHLRLDLGPDDADWADSRKAMAYVSGSGTDTLTFEYAVKPGDMDPDGVWVQTESAIAHNLVVRAKGATIRNGATDAGNILADLPTTGDAGRKVDGSTTATAAAGDDREVLTGASVTLAGSGSSTRTGATLTYAWTQTAGETVALDDAASAAPSFTAPSVRTDLVFSLTVNDGTHDSVADAVTVRVRPPANPSSAPCVHPAPPGASFTGGDNLIDQTVTGSSISFRGFFAGTARYSFWFCRPDGTRETLGQNVTGGASGHIETVSGLASGTTYWVAVQRTGHNPTWFRWQAFTTTGAATIVRVAFANAPDADGTYVLGEAIRATVTWSQAVTVDTKGSNDNVHLRLDLGPDDANYGGQPQGDGLRLGLGDAHADLRVCGAGRATRTRTGCGCRPSRPPSTTWWSGATGRRSGTATTDAGNIRAGLPTTGDAARKVDGSTSTATAAAGDDREVLTGASVTLAGSGSSTRSRRHAHLRLDGRPAGRR